MEEFATLEKAYGLFQSINCVGNENCIFTTFKNTNREGIKYGAMGAVGGLIGAAIGAAAQGNSITGDYDGFLINCTENGLGLIPLNNKGVALTLTPSKMVANPQNATFIAYNNIDRILVKNFNIFNSKVKTVNITIKNAGTLYLLGHVTEKLIPYQETEFAKFIAKYQKK